MHLAQRRARQLDRPDDVIGVAFHQHDVGALDGNVRAGTDGKPHIGLREGGSVVDAIADHAHPLALALQLLDLVRLLPRQHVRQYRGNTKARRDSVGRCLIVAREHHDLDTAFAQLRHHRGGCRTRGIGDGDQADQPAGLRDMDHRLTRAL